jgi:DNA gyrase subunit A
MNLMNITPGERITATVVVPNFDEAEYLVMITHKGRIKRSQLSEFASVRPSGLIALTLDEDDKLGWVKLTSGGSDLIVVSRSGQAIRFPESNVRCMGRGAAGVVAMRLNDGDEIRGMDVVDPEAQLLVVTERGYAKRTDLSEYSVQRRKGGGVRTLSRQTMDRTGDIVAAQVVTNEGDITLISRDGIILRTPVSTVSQQNRATMGVKVMNVKGDDVVASVAIVNPTEGSKIIDDTATNGQADPDMDASTTEL